MPLGPRHVGQRVVVRYLLAEPEPGASATDVLGVLVACHSDGLEVETESGERVRVPAGRVVAARPVPPRATRHRTSDTLTVTADRLQRVCAQGWPARTQQPLGDWLLREAAGFTGRANSVLPVGDPGLPLEEALAAVVVFYARHDLPALAQAVIGSPVEQQLLDAGWEVARHREGALVQVASLSQARRAGWRPSPPGEAPVPEVDLLDVPSPDWMALYGRTAGIPADVVTAVLAGPAVTAFAEIGPDGPGVPVAIGRGVVTGDWLGIAAVEVVHARRREGLARRVVDALLAWGAEHGAVSAYLQTMPDNTGAQALYEPYGFVTHHRYRYLAPGPGARAR